MTNAEPTIGSTRNRGANFDIEVPALKDIDYNPKQMCQIRHALSHVVKANLYDQHVEGQQQQRARQCRHR